MSVRGFKGSAAWLACVRLLGGACLFSWVAGNLCADVITLNSGRTLQGKVVTSSGSKTVALKTPVGGLIVFDRQDVKNVKRGNPSQKSATGQAAAKSQFTPQEKAWMSKVRSLVERASGPDGDQSRRARSELLKIEDENAIPALVRYLGNNPVDDSRQFLSTVLRSMPGSKAVYCLVYQSLFDPSPAVREAARKAIGSERADQARPLYIEALKGANPDLASLAAKGIAEIGDPNGESVPYLIDALIFRTERVVATSQPSRVLDAGRLEEINWQNQIDAQALAAASAPPVARVPASQIRVGAGFGGSASSMGGSPLGYANITLPPTMGPIFPPMFGAHNPPQQILPSNSAPVTLRDIFNTPIQYSTKKVQDKEINPAVHDTLTQITGQQLGKNPNNWRRWWANQVRNRALQQPKTRDRVISKSSASPDSSGLR